jgi:hypothetical protein
MSQIRGAYSVDLTKLKDSDDCPFQAYLGGVQPCCSRWGSGTPLFPFLEKCTVKDLKECPLTEYPNEVNVVFWRYWLFKKGALNGTKANPEGG